MGKKINILIPNATGPTNSGDQVILYSLLKLLKESGIGMKITVLTTDPLLYQNANDLILDVSLYAWSMSDLLTFNTKLFRSFQIFSGYFLLKLKKEHLIKNNDLLRIINHYKKADLIVYVGGGSLRTTKGIKNSYILLTMLMIYLYANLYKTKKILTPISFGPFYHNWQYKLAAKIIEKSNVISFREIYSSNMFKKYSEKKFINSLDFALFLKNKKVQKSNKNFIVGFTIRNSLNKKAQINLENSYTLALYKFAQEIPIIIQPIVQVNMTNGDEHNDLKETKNVIYKLRTFNVKTNKEIIIQDLNSAINTYGKINLLLGMRMHSNIIAATQGTPFVAISYEYKTEGIARDLGVEEYCIKAGEVNKDNLFVLLMKAYKSRKKLNRTIESSLKNIKKYETQRWNKIFQSYFYV